MILDEASLAGTPSLDRIAAAAKDAGAKLLLLGDPAQLHAVGAGGAFAMLTGDRADPPTLTGLHRFTQEWERTATLQLRAGDTSVIDTYVAHGRVHRGDTESTVEHAYQTWKVDIEAGRRSVLVADGGELVRDLNVRARADRILDGTVSAGLEVRLHDGSGASVGDVVVTRRNDRRLGTRDRWVRNGDRWTVTAVHHDGSLAVHRDGEKLGRAVVLPAAYVAQQVELGYAVTAHRAQGATVDTAHAVITSASSRESAYVAMTRGRDANTAYVATDRPDLAHTGAPHLDADSAAAVFAGVLRHSVAEQSGHDTITTDQNTLAGIARLAAEYDTIANAAQHDRWAELVRSAALGAEQADAVIRSEAFGVLTASLRRAEGQGHLVDRILPLLMDARPLDEAVDPAAVLTSRLEEATAQPGGYRSSDGGRIVGLVPAACGPMTDEMRTALDERRQLIEDRATTLAETAIRDQQPWIRELGDVPYGPAADTWWKHARTVAAYRDAHGITTNAALGTEPGPDLDTRYAARAIEDAYALTDLGTTAPTTPSDSTGQKSASDHPHQDLF